MSRLKLSPQATDWLTASEDRELPVPAGYTPSAASPVAEQISRLEAAFSERAPSDDRLSARARVAVIVTTSGVLWALFALMVRTVI